MTGQKHRGVRRSMPPGEEAGVMTGTAEFQTEP